MVSRVPDTARDIGHGGFGSLLDAARAAVDAPSAPATR